MCNGKEPCVEKLETGIPGFDSISSGDLQKNRTTLLTGTWGSTKRVFAPQLLAEGMLKGNAYRKALPYGNGHCFRNPRTRRAR